MGIEEKPVGALNPEMQGIKLWRVDFFEEKRAGKKHGAGKAQTPRGKYPASTSIPV